MENDPFKHHKDIISRIKAALGFDSDVELANFLGIKSQGITRAKKGKGVPNNWLDKANRAGVRRRWMLSGEWPMMIGDETGSADKIPLDNKYADLIEKASKILVSKTIYKLALEQTIDALYEAVETKEDLEELNRLNLTNNTSKNR